ncbi:DUF59 domain-containing protein [Candidatus Woesearchaeota archaeon]|nr:DUF59 domain-containing protein [Candidatus Woesearchaeota archaeon]
MIEKKQVIEALKACFDPELQVDVWTLGLIYDISLSGGKVSIKMTLTTPFCPYGPQLIEEIEQKVKGIDGVIEVSIELVFEPSWQPSDELRAMLGV